MSECKTCGKTIAHGNTSTTLPLCTCQWKPNTESPLAYIASLEARIADLEAKSIQDAKDIITLIGQLRYCVGIAERGRNEKMSDDVTPEAYLLEYVKELEALIKESKEHKPVAEVKVAPLLGNESTAKFNVVWANGIPHTGKLFAAPVMKEKI